MVRVPAYLAARFLHRIFVFVEHWYAGGFRVARDLAMGALRRLDRTFALAVTLRHFFEPLYQDRTFIGHVLGVIFRTLRIALAAALYGALLAVAAPLYLLWAVIPPFVLLKILQGFA